jgi:hypothetical protein
MSLRRLPPTLGVVLRATVASVATVAAVASVAACSQFGAAAAPEDGDGDGAVSRDDGGGTPPIEGDAATATMPCKPLAPTLAADFTSGFGLLDTPFVKGGGSVAVTDGVLVATAPQTSSAADVRHTIAFQPGALGQARLAFVMKDFTKGPPGSSLEVGCGLELRASDNNTFTTMRFELKDGNFRLDDTGRAGDGGTLETGGGPVTAFLTTLPQTLSVDVVIDVDPSSSSFVSRATVGGGPVHDKTSPLVSPPDSATLKCGVLSFSAPSANDVGYQAHIDDVRLDLCARAE